MKKIYIAGAVVLSMAACKPNIEPKAPERGDADFSRYLAVGSSHTAGVTNGALYVEGQMNSYPRMLSEQFKTVGGGDFKQPLVPGEHGWPIGKKILDYVQGPCDTMAYLTITPFKGALDTAGTGLNIYSTGPFNNMGLPGAKITDYLVAGFGTQNRYAARMFNRPTSARMLEEIQNPAHTFFTAWVGMDDVMDYAVMGGDMPGAPFGHRGKLTDPYTFEFAYDSTVNVLTRNGAKGVLMNIPDILDMPFFRAIGPRTLQLDVVDANKLNLQYNSTQVHFDVGMNYYVIEDTKEPNGFRQMRDGEIIRMDVPMDSIKCYGWGSVTPMPARYVLTSDEITRIQQAIGGYNNSIEKIANNYNLPIADMRYYLKGVIDSGARYNGARFNFDAINGNFFSLDGIHFTGKGNALIANSVINTINDYYKASIPYVDANKYPGTKRP